MRCMYFGGSEREREREREREKKRKNNEFSICIYRSR